MKGVTGHKMRHTFASCLLDRGVDIVTVRQLLAIVFNFLQLTMRYTHTNLQSTQCGGGEAVHSRSAASATSSKDQLRAFPDKGHTVLELLIFLLKPILLGFLFIGM